jgi:hypothetical protein
MKSSQQLFNFQQLWLVMKKLINMVIKEFVWIKWKILRLEFNL